MSDIKYILAAADNGEQTRFPCLAVVRYAAATVVSVLALAVIALVIHAVLRSEDIRLSVNDRYIGADNLWNQTSVPASSDPTAIVVAGRQKKRLPLAAPTDQASFSLGGVDIVPKPNLGRSYGNNNGLTDRVTLQRANMTNLLVTLIANNPGGRTKIDCNDTTVTLTDMDSPGQYEIGSLELGTFTVQPQTSITLQQRLKIRDTATLTHIWKYHGGDISFSVMVQVSANVTSYPLGKKTTKTQTYVCRQVTVGLIDYETYLAAADDAECRPS